MSEDKEKIEVLEEKTEKKEKLEKPKRKPKVDPELRTRIARMEKEKRETAIKKAEKVAPKIKPEQPAGVLFKLWWVDVSKRLNLKPYLKEIVWADFKSRGLGKREPKEKYDQAMAKFGYKV